jgi:metal transporter CNNM
VYALPSDTVMDEDTMVKIWSRGFSRIPVYSASADECAVSFSSTDAYEVDTSRIIGVLLTRQLIVVNHEEKRPITTLPLAPPPCIAPSVHLVDLINLFQAGGGRGKPGLHLAIVCARPFLASSALEKGQPIPKECGVVGIVTLEDVVEELLQEEIYDETDRDLELARWGVDKWKKFVKKKKAVKSDSNTGAHFDSLLVKKVVIASEMNTESTPLLR